MKPHLKNIWVHTIKHHVFCYTSGCYQSALRNVHQTEILSNNQHVIVMLNGILHNIIARVISHCEAYTPAIFARVPY